MALDPLTENTDDGAFVTRAELKVLFGLWSYAVDDGRALNGIDAEARRQHLAIHLGVAESLVERVEALLYAEGA